MANGKIIAPGNGAAVINLNQSIQMFGSERTQVNVTEVDVYPDIEGEVLESKDSHQIPEQEKYMRECAFAAAMVNLQKNMQKESLLSLHAKAGVIQTITLPDKFIAVTTGNGFYTENEPILKSKNIEYENELCAPCSAPAIEQLKKLMAADEVKLKETYNEEELEELFDAYWDSGKFGGNWWYDEDTLAEAIYMLTLEITCLGDINLIEQTQKTEQKCNKKAEEELAERNWLVSIDEEAAKGLTEEYGTPIENPVWSGAYGMSGRFLPDNRMILLQYLANASKNGYYNEDMLAQLENNLGVVGIDFSTKNYTIDEECMYGLIERYMQYPESNKVIGKFLDNGGGLIVMGVLTLGVGCLASMKPQTGRASKNAEALEKEVEAEAEVKVEEKVAAESEGVSESGSGTRFKYEHNPMDNPKAARDIIENPDAVYGFSPNPESTRIGKYADKIDWTNPEQVAVARQTREAYHNVNESMLQDLYNSGYTTKDIAAKMVEERNMNRINSYINNGDLEGLEIVKQSNLETYGNEFGMSLEQALEKYGSYEEIINATVRSNPGMDACTGLYDIYHGGK